MQGKQQHPQVSLLITQEFNSIQTDTKNSRGGAEIAEKK
jgi:hypothetical protein